jgi:hypothetical protein
MVYSGTPPDDKGSGKGGKGGKGGKSNKDFTNDKGQSGKAPPGSITSTGQSSGDSSIGWQQSHAPPWQHVQQADSWTAQQVDPHDDNWGHTWPAPIDSSAVPVAPAPIPAGHASATAESNALAAAESAHHSEESASTHAATALQAANDAADYLSETQTVLGELKGVLKQFGKCNLCKKWYFVHRELCMYPGCSRNPLTSQVETMGQELKALHNQVAAQETLINTLLHSSGTSSSSTASPAVIEAQAQQIGTLTGIIAQMVQHSAVQPCPPSMSSMTGWQVQHIPVSRPTDTSNDQSTAVITRMPSQSDAVMPIRSKPMPVKPPSSLTATSPGLVHPPVALDHVHHAHVHAAPAELAHHYGAEHPHGDEDDDDDDDEYEGDGDEDEDDADTVASVEGACGFKPTKRKKKQVVRKGCVNKKKKPSADTQ